MRSTFAKLHAEIVDSYTDAPDFGEKTMKRIMTHFDAMPPTKSKTDPHRMRQKAAFLSRVRMVLLGKSGSIELGLPESKEFDAMSPQEQLRFQMQARKIGAPKWVLTTDVMPANIDLIC